MIQHEIAKGEFAAAAEQLEQFVSKQENTSNIEQYVSFEWIEIERQLLEGFRNLIAPIVPLQKDSPDFEAYVLALEGKQTLFINTIVRSGQLPDGMIHLLNSLYRQSKDILGQYQQLLQDVAAQSFGQIQLTAESAALLNLGLSAECKAYLAQQFDNIMAQLDEDDVCRYALQAFIRLLYAESYSAAARQSDEQLLEAFIDMQATFPTLARELADSLEEYLATDQDALFTAQYGRFGGSFQKYLLSLITENHGSILREVLASRIQRLLEQPQSLKTDEGAGQWQPYQKLMQSLATLPGHSTAHFKARLHKMTQKALRRFEQTLSLVDSDLSELLSVQAQMAQRAYLQRCALFVNVFGQPEQRMRLYQRVDMILAKMRKALMTLVRDDETYDFLAWAKPLVRLAGSQTQQTQVKQLMQAWQRYQSAQDPHAISFYQEVAPYALASYLRHVKVTIKKSLFGQYGLTQREYNQIETQVRQKWPNLQKPMHPNRLAALRHDILRHRPRANWWRAHFCEAQEPYILFGMMMMIQIDYHQQLWDMRLKAVTDDFHSEPGQVAHALTTQLQSLKEMLNLGQGRFPRQIQRAINEVGQFFLLWPASEAQSKAQALHLLPVQPSDTKFAM